MTKGKGVQHLMCFSDVVYSQLKCFDIGTMELPDVVSASVAELPCGWCCRFFGQKITEGLGLLANGACPTYRTEVCGNAAA